MKDEPLLIQRHLLLSKARTDPVLNGCQRLSAIEVDQRDSQCEFSVDRSNHFGKQELARASNLDV